MVALNLQGFNYSGDNVELLWALLQWLYLLPEEQDGSCTLPVVASAPPKQWDTSRNYFNRKQITIIFIHHQDHHCHPFHQNYMQCPLR